MEKLTLSNDFLNDIKKTSKFKSLLVFFLDIEIYLVVYLQSKPWSFIS